MDRLLHLIIVFFAIAISLTCHPTTSNAITCEGNGELENFSYEIPCTTELTDKNIKNSSFKIHIYRKDDNLIDNPPFTLEKFTNGKTANSDDASIKKIAFGELTSTNTKSAVVVIEAYNGGNFYEYELCALTKVNGNCVVLQAHLSYPTILIDSLTLKNNHIFLGIRYRGGFDSFVNPTKKGVIELGIVNNKFVIIKDSTNPTKQTSSKLKRDSATPANSHDSPTTDTGFLQKSSSDQPLKIGVLDINKVIHNSILGQRALNQLKSYDGSPAFSSKKKQLLQPLLDKLKIVVHNFSSINSFDLIFEKSNWELINPHGEINTKTMPYISKKGIELFKSIQPIDITPNILVAFDKM